MKVRVFDIGHLPFTHCILVIRDKDEGVGIDKRHYVQERTCHVDLTETNETANINTWECSSCGKSFEEAYGSYEFCPHCGAMIVEERR